MYATVVLPRVPVTPTIFAPVAIAYFAKSAVDITREMPASRAAAISGESSGTPAAFSTMSQCLKSSASCPPSLNVTLGYFFNFATEPASSASDFLSVTKTSAPHVARNSTSPTHRPKSPSPRTVIRLFLNKFPQSIQQLYRLRIESHLFRLYRFFEKDTAEGIKRLCVTRAIKPYCSVFPDTLFPFLMPLQIPCETFGHDIAVGDDAYVSPKDLLDFLFQYPVMRATENQRVDVIFEKRRNVRVQQRVGGRRILLPCFD